MAKGLAVFLRRIYVLFTCLVRKFIYMIRGLASSRFFSRDISEAAFIHKWNHALQYSRLRRREGGRERGWELNVECVPMKIY